LQLFDGKLQFLPFSNFFNLQHCSRGLFGDVTEADVHVSRCLQV